ncbi:MAG: VanZ family protein [Hydrogenibacillus schlegelii]|uniref:VanZ family protein n=1 Tax=Hydrogenibacillus schlegelii TaxID=1484 RepID=A0A947CU52_HYDSH|nr:VanZ family protein [Hydrogenibacillus schlegelii]
MTVDEKKGHRPWRWWLLLLGWVLIVFALAHQPYERQDLKPVLRTVFPAEALHNSLPNVSFEYAGSLVSAALNPYGFVEFFIRKLGHAALYAAGATAFFFALRRSGLRHGVILWLMPVFIAAVAALDEIQQIWTPGRTPSVADIALDLLGASVAVTVLLKRRNRRLSERQRRIAWGAWAVMLLLGTVLLGINVRPERALTAPVDESELKESPYADILRLGLEKERFATADVAPPSHAAPPVEVSASPAGPSEGATGPPETTTSVGEQPSASSAASSKLTHAADGSSARASDAPMPPTAEAIVDAYRADMEALRDACEGRLLALAEQAYGEYRAAKNAGRSPDLGAMARRYSDQARELQKVCDATFYRLLRQMERDLDRYGYALDPVWEAEKTYEQMKAREKDRLLAKVQSLLRK